MGDFQGHPFRGNQYTQAVAWAGGEEGFIDGGKTYRVFHGTTAERAEKIRRMGLVKPEGVGEPSWFMVTTSKAVAEHFAKGYSGDAVLEFRIPAAELKQVLWKGSKQDWDGDVNVQHGLRGGRLSPKYIHKVHRGWTPARKVGK